MDEAGGWPQLPGEQGNGPGPGGGVIGGGGDNQDIPKKSYSGIAAINTSVRDKKNVLEVRLERSEGARFNLSMVETEGLLRKLGIDENHFGGVSSCPEGKGVVYITLHPSVNISRFLHKKEAYVLKEGIQTSVIRPAMARRKFQSWCLGCILTQKTKQLSGTCLPMAK